MVKLCLRVKWVLSPEIWHGGHRGKERHIGLEKKGRRMIFKGDVLNTQYLGWSRSVHIGKLVLEHQEPQGSQGWLAKPWPPKESEP